MNNIARKVIADIGYNSSEIGFDAESCAVITAIGKQSADIAMGVDRTSKEEQGAGDQGLMFGYASNETDVLMPAPITYAHRLMRDKHNCAKKMFCPGCVPMQNPNYFPLCEWQTRTALPMLFFPLNIILILPITNLVEAVIEEIIKPVLPEEWLKKTKYYINPTGRFVIGGPQGDCGLTGRKIIVDYLRRHGASWRRLFLW